ncbi:MAG: hypothetical protein IH586_23510, partial [Anaerolineaceae bacterium]|nr:hypothetical protein [Anaerolineaceae bacterium]
IDLARARLADRLPAAVFVGGSNGNFAEFNRNRPEIEKMDGVCYTINPQIHSFDERSLIENIEAQKDTLLTARSFCGKLPVSISSVTLKPPFNVVATEQGGLVDPDVLPPAVDPRQMSLFGAVWTAGSIGALAAGGAASVTYYETTGWKGLLENSEGCQLPNRFLSVPGMIFPVYWIFDFLTEYKGAQVLGFSSSSPLRCGGLALRKGNRTMVLAVNYQPAGQAIRLCCLPGNQAAIRRLNQDTARMASTDPDAFRSYSTMVKIDEGKLVLTLQPYESVLVEI